MVILLEFVFSLVTYFLKFIVYFGQKVSFTIMTYFCSLFFTVYHHFTIHHSMNKPYHT